MSCTFKIFISPFAYNFITQLVKFEYVKIGTLKYKTEWSVNKAKLVCVIRMLRQRKIDANKRNENWRCYKIDIAICYKSTYYIYAPSLWGKIFK